MFRNLLLSFAFTGLVVAPPTPVAAQTPLLPPRGETAAPIVILLFSDFQCPYCVKVDPVLKEIRDQFPKDVQVVFKHNPLPIHPQAPLAHEAAVEAGRQGKFWEMHDLLFANQGQLQPEHLTGYARTLGLDVAAFTAAIEARTHRAAVERGHGRGAGAGRHRDAQRLRERPARDGGAGRRPFVNLMKSLLAGGDGSEPAPVPTSTFDLTGAPAKGPADAPVTIVEFSDFQCSFCFRANATVAQVLERVRGQGAAGVQALSARLPSRRPARAPRGDGRAAAGQVLGDARLHLREPEGDEAGGPPRAREGARPRRAAVHGGFDSDRFKTVLDRDLAEGGKVGVERTAPPLSSSAGPPWSARVRSRRSRRSSTRRSPGARRPARRPTSRRDVRPPNSRRRASSVAEGRIAAMSRTWLTSAFLLLSAAAAAADVRLPAIFSDHMVLQQQMPLTVWGWADPAERIEVRLRTQRVSTTADRDGHWQVALAPETAGGPDELVVTGASSSKRFTDVLVGEVWIASGQSNMQWALRQAQDGPAEIAKASHPRIRILPRRSA